MQTDYYKIMQLHPECDQAIIPRMRKVLAQIFHPDTAPIERRDAFTAIMQRINDAADMLSCPERRKEYDSRHPYFTLVRYGAAGTRGEVRDHEDKQGNGEGRYSHAGDLPSFLRQYLSADLLYGAAKKARELGVLDPFSRRALYNFAKRIEKDLCFSRWQTENFRRIVEMSTEAGILGAR